MKTSIANKFLLLVLIFVANGSFGAQASFEPVANNTLYEDNPSYASGLSSYLFVGPIASGSPRRSLLQFDLNSLPANVQVTSATLSITIDRAARNSDASDTIALHRVLASWGQGTSDAGSGGSGTQASAGDSTWSARFYNSPPGFPSTLWNQPGGDFLASASASQAIGVTLGAITLASSQQLVNDVQAWVGNANLNYGWIFLAAEGMEFKARRFYGLHTFAPTDRPKLTVEYELAPSIQKVPFMSPWTMVLLALGIISIARSRLS